MVGILFNNGKFEVLHLPAELALRLLILTLVINKSFSQKAMNVQ